MNLQLQLEQAFFSGQMSLWQMEQHVAAGEMVRPSGRFRRDVVLLGSDNRLDRLIYEIDAVMNGYSLSDLDARKHTAEGVVPRFTPKTLADLRTVLRKHLV